MSKQELLPDMYPIHAEPIVIDYSDRIDQTQVFIEVDDFAYESLHVARSREFGLWSQEVVVETIIECFELPILPPETWRRLPNGQKWGPIEHDDYFIQPQGIVDSSAEIGERILRIGNDNLSIVTNYIIDLAGRKISSITDEIEYEELPAAFRSEVFLKELINGGHVLGFEDFQSAAYSIGTSPAKGADVFDTVIKMLGDDEAKEWVGLLEIHGNPYARRDIRGQLYVATQALANLLAELDENPELHPELNLKSRAVLRAILED